MRRSKIQFTKRDACGGRPTRRGEGMVISFAMPNLRCVLAGSVAVFLVGQATASAQPVLSALSTLTANSQVLLVTTKKPIDKSCLMVCERWGNNGCLKWVTKCKGDPGYPRGGSNTRK